MLIQVLVGGFAGFSVILSIEVRDLMRQSQPKLFVSRGKGGHVFNHQSLLLSYNVQSVHNPLSTKTGFLSLFIH